MSAGASTTLVLVLWALPIVVGVILMIMRYEPPPPEELTAELARPQERR